MGRSRVSGPVAGLPRESNLLCPLCLVWWDAVSDPAHPGWRCEVPAPRGGEAGRKATALTAAAGDWRAALAEARAALKDRIVEGD